MTGSSSLACYECLVSHAAVWLRECRSERSSCQDILTRDKSDRAFHRPVPNQCFLPLLLSVRGWSNPRQRSEMTLRLSLMKCFNVPFRLSYTGWWSYMHLRSALALCSCSTSCRPCPSPVPEFQKSTGKPLFCSIERVERRPRDAAGIDVAPPPLLRNGRGRFWCPRFLLRTRPRFPQAISLSGAGGRALPWLAALETLALVSDAVTVAAIVAAVLAVTAIPWTRRTVTSGKTEVGRVLMCRLAASIWGKRRNGAATLPVLFLEASASEVSIAVVVVAETAAAIELLQLAPCVVAKDVALVVFVLLVLLMALALLLLRRLDLGWRHYSLACRCWRPEIFCACVLGARRSSATMSC